MAKKDRERIVPRSGNVFADMGLPDAEELDAEARRLLARASRGSKEKLKSVLAKVNDSEPEAGDRV